MNRTLGYLLISIGIVLALSSSGCALSYAGAVERGMGWIVLLFGGLPTLLGVILIFAGRKCLTVNQVGPAVSQVSGSTDTKATRNGLVNNELRAHLEQRAKVDRAIKWIGAIIIITAFLPIFPLSFGHPVGLGIYLWFSWVPVTVGIIILIGGKWRPSIKPSSIRNGFGAVLCCASAGSAIYFFPMTVRAISNFFHAGPAELLIVCGTVLTPAAFFLIGVKPLLAQSTARFLTERQISR